MLTIKDNYLPYQHEARTWLNDPKNSHALIGAEPGLGKTAMALTSVIDRRTRALVVAPLHLCYTTWIQEPAKWEHTKNLKIQIMHGTARQSAFDNARQAHITIINPESLTWLEKQCKIHKIIPWTNFIIDESTSFKEHKTKKFAALYKLSRKAKYILLLSGNTTPNSLMDLWAQYGLVDNGKALESSFYKFRTKYFYTHAYKKWSWELKEHSQERIINQIAPLTFNIPIEGNLDLPPIVENDIHVQLPASVVPHYKKMKSDLVSQLADDDTLQHVKSYYNPEKALERDQFRSRFSPGNVDNENENKVTQILSPHAAVASLKCWQIANGFIFSSLSRLERAKGFSPDLHILHHEKITALKQLVESANCPLFVGYWFKPSRDAIAQAFPEAVHFDKSDTANLKHLVNKWNRGQIPILYAQIASAAFGLNLQYGPGYRIVFYSVIPGYNFYDQFIRRIARQGSKHDHIFVDRIIAQNTIDETWLYVLNQRKALKETLYEALCATNHIPVESDIP